MRLIPIARPAVPLLSVVLALSGSVSQPLWAQTPGQPSTTPAASTPPDSMTLGSLWPSLLPTGLFGGPSDDLTHYLERYGVRAGFGSDRRAGMYADVFDFSLAHNDGERDVFIVERRVWSMYNQRGLARFDTERVRISGGYGYFRQAANGLDYLFAPSQVDGGVDPAYTGGTVGYVGKFNDNVDDALFATARTTYGLAFEVKPAAFGDKAAAKVAFRGLERSGHVPASLNTGGSDVLGTDADRRAKLRWQGYESTVDESTDELLFTAAVRPTKQVNIEYELGYERFRNDAATVTFTDLAAVAGVRIASTNAEAGPEGAFAAAVAGYPLHFLPDSNMVRQSLWASAGNDRVLFSAGAGWNALTQQTFTDFQIENGYRQGDIESNQFFATIAARPSSAVRVEGYARRSETNRKMDRFENKLRLNAFTLWTYGLEAEMRPGGGRFTLTPGWTRRTTDRDIEYGEVPAPRSLIAADSSSDELFVRTRWRFSPRVSLRATPSVLWADQTGYVTEPAKAAKLNVALSYASADGMRSATAFYTIRTGLNDDRSFDGTDGRSVTQDARRSLQQLGITGSVAPREAINVFGSYAWSRDRYNANLFSTTTRRYDPTPVFYSRDDRQTYLLGSHTITGGADVTSTGGMTYTLSYTATRTAGDTTTGTVLSVLPEEDGRIENWYQTIVLRAERDLGTSLRLGISYLLDYYSDATYADLTGGLNAVIVGIGYRF